MGIPGFMGQFLSKNVAKAIFTSLPPYVASLSFDLNGVLHEARKLVYGENVDPRLQSAFANADPDQL